MSLSNELISQFAKVTKVDKNVNKESTVWATAVEYNGSIYVRFDGSDGRLTPISTTTNIKPGERVLVTIKNHSAIVTGNISSPTAGSNELQDVEHGLSDKMTSNDLEAINGIFNSLESKTAEFDNMEAINADIEKLKAHYAELEYISAKDIEALNIEAEKIRAKFGEFTDISTTDLEAINADIDNLVAYNASFTYVSAEVLKAMKADIKELDVENLSAKYANIDFSNIKMAAVEELFTKSGIIKDLVVDDQSITGELVGVTIKGDLIEGNTIKADKLVVKGSDGVFYKLNVEAGGISAEQAPQDSLHGSVITAKSITAEKVSVKDLVAFGATIGGFHITDVSLYSGAKESVNNTTRGIYQDSDGQFAVGDANNYLKFYVDDYGQYTFDIVANRITLSSTGISLDEVDIKADNAQQTADESMVSIDVINDVLSMLVTDENGTTILEQTGEGWSYNFASVTKALEEANETLHTLEGSIGAVEEGSNVKDMIDELGNLIKDLNDRTAYIDMKTETVDGVTTPYLELGKRDDLDGFKVKITNSTITFKMGSLEPIRLENIDGEGYVVADKLTVSNELRIGDYVWQVQANGNVSLVWKGAKG